MGQENVCVPPEPLRRTGVIFSGPLYARKLVLSFSVRCDLTCLNSDLGLVSHEVTEYEDSLHLNICVLW